MKTAIKTLLHLTRLESVGGDEGHSGSQLFFKSLTLSSEDEQITRVLLAQLSWIQVQRVR